MENKALFLRNVLWIDALTCLVSGVGSLAFGSALAAPLGLSTELQHGAGFVLLGVAAFIAFTARNVSLGGATTSASRSLVWLVIIGNAAWVLASVITLKLAQPTPLGLLYVIAQALAVALLAKLEHAALRKIAPAELAVPV